MPHPQRPYWFPAKTYGWGWGLPARREGWIVLIAWLIVVVSLGPVIALRSLWLFCAFMAVLSGGLIGICWLTGEPPRWRWGQKD